jgi:putative transposase
VLNVSFSAYYAWLRSETYTLSAAKQTVQEAIKEVFDTHRRRYGAVRISKELARQGIQVGRRAVRTAMQQQGLVAIQPKSFVPKTTDSSTTHKRSSNLLLDQAKATAPFQIVVCDITYIAVADGKWLYLATIQDQFTRLIVGWALADNMRTELVIKALQSAINRYSLPEGCIVHSDGGGQYDAYEYRALLKKYGLLSSMTRRDNHYDNAQAESVFSRVKAELMQKGAFQAFDDAFTEIFEYIEIYYNRKRLHSGINYRPPIEVLEEWYKNKT